MSTFVIRNGWASDAEAPTKLIVEILTKRRPKIWKFSSIEDESNYLYWLARWAGHWGHYALKYELQ